MVSMQLKAVALIFFLLLLVVVESQSTRSQNSSNRDEEQDVPKGFKNRRRRSKRSIRDGSHSSSIGIDRVDDNQMQVMFARQLDEASQRKTISSDKARDIVRMSKSDTDSMRIDATKHKIQQSSLQYLPKTGLSGEVYDEITRISHNRPLVNGPKIMFWRPQKVGSSTILSILISYGYRYNFYPRRKQTVNYMCQLVKVCAKSAMNDKSNPNYKLYSRIMSDSNKDDDGHADEQRIDDADLSYDSILPTMMHIDHHICNLNSQLIKNEISCAFKGHPNSTYALKQTSLPEVKELFLIRDPLTRAISVYYFWGELAKVSQLTKGKKHGLPTGGGFVHKIGSTIATGIVYSNKLVYHGNETTVPPVEIAMKYASRLPYAMGFPGPSYTSSLFSDNVHDAVTDVQSDRIMTLILERLDESLVVAKYYLGWSLADVVVTKARKSSSKHPKHQQWPEKAVTTIVESMKKSGEYEVYNAGVSKLNNRISQLRDQGVDVGNEVKKLQAMRTRVHSLCYNRSYLDFYKDNLTSKGLARKYTCIYVATLNDTMPRLSIH